MINFISTFLLMISSLFVVLQHQTMTDLDTIYCQIWIILILLIVVSTIFNFFTFSIWEAGAIDRRLRMFNHYIFRLGVLMFVTTGMFVLNAMTPVSDQRAEAAVVTEVAIVKELEVISSLRDYFPVKVKIQIEGAGNVDYWLFPNEVRNFWKGKKLLVHSHGGAFVIRSIAKVVLNEQAEEFEAIKKDPKNRKSWQRLINNQQQQDQADQVFKFSLAYAKHFPGDPMLMDVAKWFVDLRKSAEVIQILNEYVQQHPRDFEALNFLGISLARVKQFSEAIERLKLAESIDPNDYLVQYNLGYAYYYWGQNHLAIEHFRKVMQKRKKFPEVQNLLNQLARFPVQR